MSVTLCPVAVVAGCKRCPVFSLCPLKGVIGDQQAAEPPDAAPTKPKPKARGGAKSKR